MQSFCVRSHNLLQAHISGLDIDDPSRAQVAFDSDAQWRSSSHKVFLADEVTTTEFFKKYGNPNEIINGTISLSSTLPARCRASSTTSLYIVDFSMSKRDRVCVCNGYAMERRGSVRST